MTMSSPRRHWPLVVLTTLACLVMAAPAGASKTHLFEEDFGSAAKPTFSSANALAVDPDSGDVLVYDAGAHTLSRFHADGTPSAFAALATNVIDGKGGGECPAVAADCDQTPQNGFDSIAYAGSQQIAIDDSGGVTDGNIYLTQGESGTNVLDVFSSDGEYLGQITSAGGVKLGAGGGFPYSPSGVAVDGNGSIYLSGPFEERIHKYVPSGNPPTDADFAGSFTASEPFSLAVGVGSGAGALFSSRYLLSREGGANAPLTYALDASSFDLSYEVDGVSPATLSVDPASGHLYSLVREEASTVYIMREYAPSSSGASLIATVPVGVVAGIAVDGTSGRIYLSSGNKIEVLGPLVAVPDVTTDPATVTGDTSVALRGTVNPDGTPLEECFFEYGLTDAYGQTVPCAETPAEIGTSQKAVHADVGGLQPETLYHYRLVAKNENGTVEGQDETVKTPSKPSVEAWSVDVGFAEATLKAAVNPESSPTTYRLEWGTDATYGQGTSEIPVGSDQVPHEFSHPLEGLEPGLTYHYRVVATNSIGVTATPDLTFHTYPEPFAPKSACPNQAFRSGASSRLPDCRAFEMVTPVEKGNTDISVRVSAQNYQARLDLSSSDGNAFSFSSEKSFGDALGAPYSSQYLVRREPGKGWLTTAISPSRGLQSVSSSVNIRFDVEYKSFSGDLSSGWLYHNTAKTHDGCAVPGYSNLYRRDNATSAYEALTTAEPEGQTPQSYWPELQGVSADGAHAVFRANAKLTDDAAGTLDANGDPILQIYEHVSGEEGGCGELRLVSVLPNGNASTTGGSVGTASSFSAEGREHNVLGAVSEDGSRIYWTEATKVKAGPGPLYLRSDGTKTVQVSSGPAQFWTASPDGSKAIYSVGEDLFEYDAVAKKSTLIAGGSRGIAGASEDLSKVYFVSKEAIGGKGEAGEANLYLHDIEQGTTALVSTLGSADVNLFFPYNGFKAIAEQPIERGTRVSSDGNTLAFVSRAGLTGYDNKDASDGRQVLEIFVYDAEAEEVFCASCNPTGSRPRGREFEGSGRATLLAAAQLPPAENSLFAPRALSEDGSHLFFESFEALVPRDTNGAADVYEWQRAGAEEACREAGAELFVPQAGGCLSLISSGQSPSDSEMIDATPSGSDVFFKTASSLLPQDPGLIDVYDARVNGGLPQPPGPPAGCEGEACQGPLSPPDDPTPASGSGEYAGNVAPEKPRCPKGKGKGKACKPCPKGKVRRHGRCVKKHNKPHKKAKNQAGQERRAGR
jgi:hypothetical protein